MESQKSKQNKNKKHICDIIYYVLQREGKDCTARNPRERKIGGISLQHIALRRNSRSKSHSTELIIALAHGAEQMAIFACAYNLHVNLQIRNKMYGCL